MTLLPLCSGSFQTTQSWRRHAQDFLLQQQDRTNLSSRNVHVFEQSERNLKNVAMFPVRKLHQRIKKKGPDLIHDDLCLQGCDNVQFGR